MLQFCWHHYSGKVLTDQWEQGISWLNFSPWQFHAMFAGSARSGHLSFHSEFWRHQIDVGMPGTHLRQRSLLTAVLFLLRLVWPWHVAFPVAGLFALLLR